MCVYVCVCEREIWGDRYVRDREIGESCVCVREMGRDVCEIDR